MWATVESRWRPDFKAKCTPDRFCAGNSGALPAALIYKLERLFFLRDLFLMFRMYTNKDAVYRITDDCVTIGTWLVLFLLYILTLFQFLGRDLLLFRSLFLPGWHRKPLHHARKRSCLLGSLSRRIEMTITQDFPCISFFIEFLIVWQKERKHRDCW